MENQSVASQEDATGARNRRARSVRSANDKLTTFIRPMLAQLHDEPFDDPEWLFEIKWDGYRAVAEVKR